MFSPHTMFRYMVGVEGENIPRLILSFNDLLILLRQKRELPFEALVVQIFRINQIAWISHIIIFIIYLQQENKIYMPIHLLLFSYPCTGLYNCAGAAYLSTIPFRINFT